MKTRFRRVFSDGTMQVRVRVLGLQLAMRVGDNHLPRFVMMGGSRAGYAWNLMAGKRVGRPVPAHGLALADVARQQRHAG